MTLGDLWMTIAQTSENLAIDEAVARIREQLKTELNLEDSDFVMVPALFQGGMAVIPNAVNSVVVNGHLLVPKPLGPRLNEKDGFEHAIREALAGCDVQVVYIDTWSEYHVAGGEIHCGTNTFAACATGLVDALICNFDRSGLGLSHRPPDRYVEG